MMMGLVGKRVEVIWANYKRNTWDVRIGIQKDIVLVAKYHARLLTKQHAFTLR
jgi:hypothetical protein